MSRRLHGSEAARQRYWDVNPTEDMNPAGRIIRVEVDFWNHKAVKLSRKLQALSDKGLERLKEALER